MNRIRCLANACSRRTTIFSYRNIPFNAFTTNTRCCLNHRQPAGVPTTRFNCAFGQGRVRALCWSTPAHTIEFLRPLN